MAEALVPPNEAKQHPELVEAATDMITATSQLQMQSASVRADRPNWKSYLQSQMIPQEDYDLVTAFEACKSSEERSDFFANRSAQTARTMLNLMTNVAKVNTVRYVLLLIDDMLQEDPSRVSVFWEYARKQKQSVWTPFLSMLSRDDGYIINQTSRIVCKLACWQSGHSAHMQGSELIAYVTFLKEQLRAGPAANSYVQTSARCLQMMLRIDAYRKCVVNMDGIQTIISVLSGKANFQLQYQLIFCLWCLTFDPSIGATLHEFNAVPVLADILSQNTKEKVVRIILATFRNMVEKVNELDIVRECALKMVQCKVLKSLELMEARKYDDPDLIEDMQYLTEKLHTNVQDLSSFDEYCTEIRSGHLAWSPVHTSEKFWRENAARLNENKFELVRILVDILGKSNDPLIISVAAHDLGEYVRHYPRGKTVLEQVGGKSAVMRLLTHMDPHVRFHALLAVQKLMVHNWEYLGKQVSGEQKGGTPDSKGGDEGDKGMKDLAGKGRQVKAKG